MRRNVLHISLATLTFALGFLISNGYHGLIKALFIALTTFTLLEIAASIEVNPRHVLVAVVTLLIWTPIAIIFLNSIGASNYSCVLGVSESARPPVPSEWLTVETSQNDATPGATDCSCDGRDENPAKFNTIWAGVVNAKATSLPTAIYPPEAKAARRESTVAVLVLIDEAGKVVWAQSISGHALLRQAARTAACRARFAPTMADGPPVRASAILTYRFRI